MLSHAVLFPDGHARHASIGGEPNPVLLDVIRRSISRMSEGSQVVAAKDADDASMQLAKAAYKALQRILQSDVYLTKEEPSGSENWNDQIGVSKTPFLVCTGTVEAQPA